MDKEQQLVFLRSQILCAEIEMQAMVAENKQREFKGEAMAYSGNDFMQVINRYGIGYNDMLNKVWEGS